MPMAAAGEVKKRGGKRPGAGRKPKAGRAEVVPPIAAAATPEPVRSRVSIEYADARAAHEYWKAQLAEQEFNKRAGLLLDRGQVERASATVLANVAQALRSIPDNLERTVGLSPEQAEEVEKIIDGLCLSLQDKLRELGGW